MNEPEQAQQIIARLQTELGQAHEQITQLESELRYYEACQKCALGTRGDGVGIDLFNIK